MTLSVERREENKKRVGIEIFIRLYVTIYSIFLLQNYSSHKYYKQASMQPVEPQPLLTVAVIPVLQFVQVAV